jgi:hypothetical protein
MLMIVCLLPIKYYGEGEGSYNNVAAGQIVVGARGTAAAVLSKWAIPKRKPTGADLTESDVEAVVDQRKRNQAPAAALSHVYSLNMKAKGTANPLTAKKSRAGETPAVGASRCGHAFCRTTLQRLQYFAIKEESPIVDPQTALQKEKAVLNLNCLLKKKA